MKYGPIIVQDKTGQQIEIRNAEGSDADALIQYLKITAAETPYLIREPEEVTLTPEQEAAFIADVNASERNLMLIALADGRHIGNCSLMGIGNYSRYRHRCDVAIALYKEYCGRGIGKIMLETILAVAKETGYEQAELEVIADNAAAIAMYENAGFKIYGTFPDNMKYRDGRYVNAYWMMKKL